MDTNRLLALEVEAQHRVNEISNLLVRNEKLDDIINTISIWKRQAGKLLITGISGKIGDDTIMGQINLSHLSGAVAVPDLLLKLAHKKLSELDAEAERILSQTELDGSEVGEAIRNEFNIPAV
jgi:hypothetical protein